MSQIDLNKLSEEEILELIRDELSDDELLESEDNQLCNENININFNQCDCSGIECSDCLFGREKRSYVLSKLKIDQEELNLSNYSDNQIVEKLKSIYKYNDLKNESKSLCQIKGNPFYNCNCVGIICSNCILDNSNRFDLIKLLKDSKPKEIMENKPSDAIELMVIRRVYNGLDNTIQVDWPIGHRTWAKSSYKNSFTKNAIIHPENNRYRMNVPATCFAPTNYSSFEGPFKVGDWIEITKSDFNWGASMNNFVGKKVQITEVFNNGWSIKFKEDDRFNWNYDQGHFIPCDPPENKASRKYTIQELESDRNLVIYLDDISEFTTIKLYTTRLNFEYAGKYCYSLFDRTYASDSSKSNLGSYANQSTTILTINDIIFPEIQQPENSFICTLDQLKNKLDIVVFLETREEYEKLKVYIPNLIEYYGPYCYSILGRTYSSNSGKTYSGSYGNVNIVLFKNIIFPDTSLSEKTVYTEPPLTKKSISGREEIYIIPLPE